MNEILSFIQTLSDNNAERFLAQGHADPGINGPYQYNDTPVRNTGHWLIIYSFLWKRTQNKKYMDVAITFADYLINVQSQSMSGAIACMDGSHFDRINGLIGQAWTIEALVYAAKALEKPDCFECALKIFNSQIFDDSLKLWKRVELDGHEVDYDYTSNHQIWFAIAGCILLDYKEDERIRSEVNAFAAEFNRTHFRIHRNGLIRHYLLLKRPSARIKAPVAYTKLIIKQLLLPMRRKNPNKYDMYAQEKGYHVFELYGFAILQYYLGAELFPKEKLFKAVEYGTNIKKLNQIYNTSAGLLYDDPNCINKYAYGYNSPAFEMPYINEVFKTGLSDRDLKSLFEIQKKLTWNPQTMQFDKNTFDGKTLTSRLYEYIRYYDLIKEKNEEN